MVNRDFVIGAVVGILAGYLFRHYQASKQGG
jgi:F0F1-type ATP synthase assembly protein I